MLPHAYEFPAAVLLVLASALTCFAGYRLFRIVLAIWGFILGASIGSSMMGVGSAVAMLIAGLAGGVLGAVAVVFAYFMGVALVGAGLGVFTAHLVWSQMVAADPPAAFIVTASIVGAIAAMVLQRYVIVVATAFFGAWMVVVAATAIADNAPGRAARALSTDVWILYPLSASYQRWTIIAWVVLGLFGMAAQLGITGSKK
jgi:hypothetical protein